jgi:Flp pilus assembly protein TadG
MRRLIPPRTGWSDERGATMVFVAVTIAVLLGMTAFAFDFARIWAEERELQSGADAAALAVAQDCSQGKCDPGYDAEGLAEYYADANAKDAAAWVPLVDIDLDAQQVTVQTATETTDGDNQFDMTFAGAIGFDGLTVTSDATVAWGSPAGLATLPLIFSQCEWESFGEPGFVEDGGFLHHGSAALNGELPPTSGYAYMARYTTIYFHGDEGPCHDSPSGQDLPGGFGWLDATSGCRAETQVGDWVSVDTGSSPSNGCSPSNLRDLLGTVVLIPYFDDVRGTGNNAEYRILGFGAYYLTAYYFTGQYREKSLIDNQYPCHGTNLCVQGYFIGDWAVQDGELGGPDLGVSIVKFVE